MEKSEAEQVQTTSASWSHAHCAEAVHSHLLLLFCAGHLSQDVGGSKRVVQVRGEKE